MTSFKRTQRKYVQKAYRVRNWGVGARKQVFVAALAIVTAEGA